MSRKSYAIISVSLNCFFAILLIGIIAARFIFNAGHSSVKHLSSGEIVFENDICTLISRPAEQVCYVNAGSRPIIVSKNEDTRSFSVCIGNLDFLLSHQYDGNGIVTNFLYRGREASIVSQYRLKSSNGDK